MCILCMLLPFTTRPAVCFNVHAAFSRVGRACRRAGLSYWQVLLLVVLSIFESVLPSTSTCGHKAGSLWETPVVRGPNVIFLEAAWERRSTCFYLFFTHWEKLTKLGNGKRVHIKVVLVPCTLGNIVLPWLLLLLLSRVCMCMIRHP